MINRIKLRHMYYKLTTSLSIFLRFHQFCKSKTCFSSLGIRMMTQAQVLFERSSFPHHTVVLHHDLGMPQPGESQLVLFNPIKEPENYQKRTSATFWPGNLPYLGHITCINQLSMPLYKQNFVDPNPRYKPYISYKPHTVTVLIMHQSMDLDSASVPHLSSTAWITSLVSSTMLLQVIRLIGNTLLQFLTQVGQQCIKSHDLLKARMGTPCMIPCDR